MKDLSRPVFFESPATYYNQLGQSILSAKSSVFLADFTFEKDAKTQVVFDSLHEALRQNHHLDIRIRLDHRGNSPLASFRTRRAVRKINQATGGHIQIQGAKNIFYPGGLKNLIDALHEKTATIDAGRETQHAYIGGMNISGRHIDYGDLMLRTSNTAIVAFLERHFQKAWNHQNHKPFQEKIDTHTTMHALVKGRDGNKPFVDYVTQKISQTEKGERVYLETGYLDKAEIRDALCKAKQRGVDVQIITADPRSDNHDIRYQFFPRQTTKPLVEGHVPLFLYHGQNAHHPEFNHTKILLINDTAFIGSFNWTTDWLSGRNEELVMETTDPEIFTLLLQKFEQDRDQKSKKYEKVKNEQPYRRQKRW